MTAAWRWACAFVSPCISLWWYLASGGTSRSISSFRSAHAARLVLDQPDRGGRVGDEHVHDAVLAPLVCTTSWTPRVMSMMSPSPSVETRSWALWTGIGEPYARRVAARPLAADAQVMKSAASQGLPGAITSRKRSSSAGSIEYVCSSAGKRPSRTSSA